MTDAAKHIDSNYIGGVPAAKLMKIWDRLNPLLKRVVKEHTGYTPEHVLTELQLNKMQAWVVNDFQAVIITSVLQKPLHKVLFVPFLAGDNMDDWLGDMGDFLEELAIQRGCKAIEFEGRKGWGKINKHYPEYKPLRVTYRREL